MSEEPKNSAAPPSKEPTMADKLRAAGFKVPDEPDGTGFIIGDGGPVRPKPLAMVDKSKSLAPSDKTDAAGRP